MKNSVILSFVLFSFGGRSQITIIPTGVTEPILQISALSNTNIVVCGRDGYFSRSIDECDTLTPMRGPGPPGYQQFLHRLDENKSFVLSNNFGAYNNKIYKSTNDGNNWSLVLDTSGLLIEHLKFWDANEGLAISTFNKAIRLKNGGATRLQSYSPYIATDRMEIYGDSLVALGGSSGGVGSVVISKDRGNTWMPGGIGFGSQSFARDIFFLNKDTIFAISTKGFWGPYLAKSFDGGANWQKVVIPDYGPYGVCFRKANEGYIAGINPATLKGIVAKTTDMGQTWSVFDTQVSTQLLDIKFLNDSVALLSGTNGVLLKWNYKASVFVGINDRFSNNHLINFAPNPVKDKLRLDVSESQAADLKFSISNALGQLVYPESPLLPSQEIEMSGFKAGIYFLKIQNPSGYRAYKIIRE